ncbi:pyridoxal phosphate-dependent aminotransferase [Nonomuraea sp. NN258]|uniref:pyridoxal phosphate-dependent aminotransferase n=1 Tax=Nonomuraea antri TaxID=2730852 RepID=UPI00156881EF|nr:pyridoxal phosphate-dependent aminotransferase [Nonomuraea antri]NRQ39769.1 pyridoxal phosphate-dependent aminotransferase [Nonomuraea antri]
MPALNDALNAIPSSPFLDVQRLLERRRGTARTIPLHQGKTWFEPCARPRDWAAGEFELAPHQHAPPGGVPMLRQAIASQAGERRGVPVPAERVVVTAGATHAISMILQAVLDPGDQVVILSPQWLFASGLVAAAGGVAREVPVFLELSADPGFDFASAVEAAVGPRTRAVYFNNPNNPTGFRLDAAALRRLAALAERHDLWLIADNAYEAYDFSTEGFVDVAALEGAGARTFSVHSFSKTYAMPGARAGYLICPPGCEQALGKWALYSTYAVSTTSQFLAYQALTTPAAELAARAYAAAAAWSLVRGRLEIPHTTAHGGLYTFLDVRAAGGAAAFVRRCAARGIGLAPGPAFGRNCAGWVRLCFTAVPPEPLAEALDDLNKLYREGDHDL